MIAVIFELWPAEGRAKDYFDRAAELRGVLERLPGFLSIERFQSLTEPGKLLSLSFFADETSVQAWRNSEAHRDAQHAGRAGIFDDYRLRVARVLRDYGMDSREEAPEDSRVAHG